MKKYIDNTDYIETIMKTISMIIPIYNEEKTIGTFLENLKPFFGRCQILFVDGGSKDQTLQMIPESPYYQVLRSKKGRADQMNYGAVKSSGQILFFLHCDSKLPITALEEIQQVMDKYQAGCFGIAFHSGNLWMRCCQYFSNLRVRVRRIMFGDQGIFIDRELFIEIRGFPDLPIMEDYQFSLTLREKGVKIGMTSHRIYTSDRRFAKGGRLAVMWQMNRLQAAYRRGCPIEEIAKSYQDIR